MQLCMLLSPALSSASDVKLLMKEIVKMVNFGPPECHDPHWSDPGGGRCSSPGDAIHGEGDSGELCP